MARRPTSLTSRIERYFADNPHEYPTFDDMTLKFGVPLTSIRAALRDLRAENKGPMLYETVSIVRAMPRAEAVAQGESGG